MNRTANTELIKGIGIGMAAGAALGMIVVPKRRSKACAVGRALRAAGSIVDNIAGAVGM